MLESWGVELSLGYFFCYLILLNLIASILLAREDEFKDRVNAPAVASRYLLFIIRPSRIAYGTAI